MITTLALLLGLVLGGASTLALVLFAAVIIEDDEKQKGATPSAVAVRVQGNNGFSNTGIISSSSSDDVTYH